MFQGLGEYPGPLSSTESIFLPKTFAPQNRKLHLACNRLSRYRNLYVAGMKRIKTCILQLGVCH